jgi:hypothetical protein
VLFGGNDDPRTWAWNGAEWRVVAERGPTPREMHAMTYDAARERVVLFGGGTGADELWEWDGARWTQVLPGGEHTGAPQKRQTRRDVPAPGLSAHAFVHR